MCGPLPCDKPECTWKEPFRHKTELAFVHSMDPFARDAYLALVTKSRGADAANKLRTPPDKVSLRDIGRPVARDNSTQCEDLFTADAERACSEHAPTKMPKFLSRRVASPSF